MDENKTYVEQVKELTVDEINKQIKALEDKYNAEKAKLKQDLTDAKAKIVAEEITLSAYWALHRENVIVALVVLLALKAFGVI